LGRRLIESPWYQQRWADRFTLTSDQNTKGQFDNNRTGYRLSTSVGGASTGEGGDRIVCDDPHSVQMSRALLRWNMAAREVVVAYDRPDALARFEWGPSVSRQYR
jgi:hypothetical protein